MVRQSENDLSGDGMFPQFDQLNESQSAANALKLSDLGFTEPESGVAILTRLKTCWVAAQGKLTIHSKRPPGPTAGVPFWFEVLERVAREAPLRDTVLNVVDQYVRNASEFIDVFALFEQTPRALEILARLACGSPFLTQILLLLLRCEVVSPGSHVIGDFLWILCVMNGWR